MTPDPNPNEAGGVVLAGALVALLLAGIVAGVKVVLGRIVGL